MGRVILMCLLVTGCYGTGYRQGYANGWDDTVEAAKQVFDTMCTSDSLSQGRVLMHCVTKDGQAFDLVRTKQPTGGL